MSIKTKCINDITPVFSWILEDCTDQKQIAYNVTVYSAEGDTVWSSGTVYSDHSTGVTYEGPSLKENTKYLWKVTVTTERSFYDSETSSFITALRHFDDLNWVCADAGINAPMIHKEFTLRSISDSAVLNVCGLGYFEVYINGRKVSNELLNPARTDYGDVEYRGTVNTHTGTTRKSLKYLSYEVSEYLIAGQNKITVWLGNGWYKQTGRTVEGIFYYGDVLKMFFQLVNGSEIIQSDEDCYCTESPIIYDNIFYGEIYDARRTCDTRYPVSITTAPSGLLALQLCPPERIRKTPIPSVVKQHVYDAGICLTGFAKITCTGNAGDEIRIFYAEDIDANGELDYSSTVGYGAADKAQIQTDKYILCGNGEEVYAPRFVWHAFRYFKICTTGNAVIKDVKVHYVCTDLTLRTTFTCSNELINQIHRISQNTQLSNTHGSMPMDCSHRERLG